MNNISRVECHNFNVFSNFDNLLNMLDDICCEIAKHFNLYIGNGKPRKAMVIDTLFKYTCLSCIYQRLSKKSLTSDVDAVYKECHKLAVNILVERLYWLLKGMGYTVAIATETELGYGKADIVITVTKFGVNLAHQNNALIIEVKIGNSLSLSQLFRYLLSGKGNSIVVWRVKKRQILIFNTEDLKPLLAEFATMIYLRANRLLSASQIACEHKLENDYSPTQEELQLMIPEFTRGLQETLPLVISIALQKLGLQNGKAVSLDIK